MALSFIKGRKLVTPTKVQGGRKDPLGSAKEGIIKAVEQQKDYAALTKREQPLPKAKGNRSVSTWFQKQADGWVTTVRYGQLSIPLDEKGTTGVLVGATLDDLGPFYDAVIDSIRKGELDTIIAEMQKKRSESLKGRTRKK